MEISLSCGRITLPGQGFRLFLFRLREVHEKLGLEYQQMVQKNFEGEHEPNGTPWRQLSPQTARKKVTRKKKRGFHPILRVSGRMAKTHIRATPAEAVIGSNLKYAAIHQFGGEISIRAGKARLHFRRDRKTGQVRFTSAKDRRARWGMETGRRAHKVKIPARPWLFGRDGGVPEAFRQELVAIVQAELGRAFAD